MKRITFVTGNEQKFYEASIICRKFSIDLAQKKIDIDEIQHHDPLEITKAKAKSAYQVAGQPIIVNDSSWSIPALGGFPGGYMKDVTAWLQAEDFLALMRDKQDRSIILTEVVTFYDGARLKMFKFVQRGRFITRPAGESLPSFRRVVAMEDDNITISQRFDKSDREVNEKRYQHWADFARWYSG